MAIILLWLYQWYALGIKAITHCSFVSSRFHVSPLYSQTGKLNKQESPFKQKLMCDL